VNSGLKRRLCAGRSRSMTLTFAALALALAPAFVAITWAGATRASADEGQRALAWRAANLLHTPFDSSLRNASIAVPAGARPGTRAMISYTMKAEAARGSSSAPGRSGLRTGEIWTWRYSN
jgi:hypothetical protein